MKKLIAVLLFFFGSLSADMPEPYNSLVDLPFDGQGWFINAEELGDIIRQYNPKTVIEIGSWLGCSTRFIAENIADGGIVYAVDTWLGSPNEPEHMRNPKLKQLYQQFLSNVKHAGLTDKIIPVRMDSIEASKALNVKADLIYIDGAHDTLSVYNDVIAWYPHLNKGGAICGDDWGWASVQAGVKMAAAKLNRKVQGHQGCWWFVRE